MYEVPSWKFEPRPLFPTPHKHLYLWSDHRVKGVRYEVPSWKLEPRLLFPTLHKNLYL